MRGWLSLVVLSMVPACGGGDSGPPDARIDFPDADFHNCLPAAERTADCMVDLSGSVVDFVTGTRIVIAGAPRTTYIRVTTAFDGPVPYASECLPLHEFPVPAATGMFGQSNVRCDSPMNPPQLLLTVDDPPGAPNAVGSAATLHQLTCAGSDCGALDLLLQAPIASDVSTWRQTLNDDGVTDAFIRGLVFVQYLEVDGTPAAGVTPTILDGAERPLMAGAEVRFLAADRQTILGPTQTITTPSGVAVVLLPPPTGTEMYASFAADLGGTRAADIWAVQPAIFANGFIFLLSEKLP